MSRFSSRVYRRWRLANGSTGALIQTGRMALPPPAQARQTPQTPQPVPHAGQRPHQSIQGDSRHGDHQQ